MGEQHGLRGRLRGGRAGAMRCVRRKTWRNHTGNQQVDPLRICYPETLADLVAVVREADEEGCTVRAVGSGHSWSDAALGNDFLVETHRLNRPLELELDTLRAGVDAEGLVRVEAGMRIRELNQLLDGSRRALSNMGGYDAQTVAGVISTSTHGSGLRFGPLSDFVRSLDVVSGAGQVYRVEPGDGPTDRGGYRGGELHQDDDWFR